MFQLGNGIGLNPTNRDVLETTILDRLSSYGAAGASMHIPGPAGLADNYNGSEGQLPIAVTNTTVGYLGDQLSADEGENRSQNSEYVGMGNGVTPGPVFPGWNISSSNDGITHHILPWGEDSKGKYLDVRVFGTAATSIRYIIVNSTHSAGPFAAAKLGEIWSAECTVEVIAGTIPAGGLTVMMNGYTAGMASYVEGGSAPITTNNEQTVVATRRFVNASTVVASAAIQVVCNVGVPVDITYRIRKMHFNKGRIQPYLPTTGTPVVRSKAHIPYTQNTTARKPLLASRQENWAKWARRTDQVDWLVLNATKETRETHPVYGVVSRVTANTAVGQHNIRFSCVDSGGANIPNGSPCIGRIYIRPVSGVGARNCTVQLRDKSATFPATVRFNTISGVVTSVSGCTGVVTKALDGFWEVIIRDMTVGTGASTPQIKVDMYDGVTLAGDTDSAIEVAGGTFLVGTPLSPLPAEIPATPALPPFFSNEAPFCWVFDGVDDRMELVEQIFTGLTDDHFRIAAFRMPATAPASPLIVVSDTNAVAIFRQAQIFINTATLNVVAAWVDNAGLAGGPALHTRAASEFVVATVKSVAGTRTLTTRGNIGTIQNTSSATVLANSIPTISRLGCNNPSTGDTNFFAGQIYGIIQGNGALGAADQTAFENYLAGLMGVNLVP